MCVTASSAQICNRIKKERGCYRLLGSSGLGVAEMPLGTMKISAKPSWLGERRASNLLDIPPGNRGTPPGGNVPFAARLKGENAFPV